MRRAPRKPAGDVSRPLVALVGRPNVGKSTLFNRIAGRRLAIVEDVPGVTRDRNYADVEWDGFALSFVDTGGFEPQSADRLMQQVKQQAQLAVDEAQAVVLVVDAREGLTNVDEAVAALLRRSGKPLFLAVNKVDSEVNEGDLPIAEFHGLGFGDVHTVSAEHARGVAELLEAIITAVNALLGKDRFVVSDVPGTTRDSIDSEIEHRGRPFIVTDTAGIRRKRSIALKVEAYSVVRAMRSIDRAEVVACLLDATEAGAEQDARLLGLVAEKAKVLICVVNKWDLAEREGATQAWYREQLKKKLPFVAWAPLLFTTAKDGVGVGKVLDTAARLVEQYRARFPTPALNELLENAQDSNPAPISGGRRTKLYYVAQVGYAPPTFAVQCNRPDGVSDHYRRFIENRFREAFGLEVPIRIIYKERRRRARPPTPATPGKQPRPKRRRDA